MAKTDIKMAKNSDGIYDIAIDGVTKDLVSDASFDTNIQCSLFTDGRADASQIQQPEKRRGWFGDTYTTFDGYQIGSLLWLLSQARLTNVTINKAVSFARKSLSWIIEKEYATRIDVAGASSNNENIFITIKIYVDDNLVSSFTYPIWRQSQYA